MVRGNRHDSISPHAPPSPAPPLTRWPVGGCQLVHEVLHGDDAVVLPQGVHVKPLLVRHGFLYTHTHQVCGEGEGGVEVVVVEHSSTIQCPPCSHTHTYIPTNKNLIETKHSHSNKVQYAILTAEVLVSYKAVL